MGVRGALENSENDIYIRHFVGSEGKGILTFSPLEQCMESHWKKRSGALEVTETVPGHMSLGPARSTGEDYEKPLPKKSTNMPDGGEDVIMRL